MTEATTLMVPKKLAEAIRKIVEKRDVPSTWSAVARDVLWGWVAMHRARGALDE